jgi:hypothetical protein
MEYEILVIDNYDSFTYNLVQYIERVLKAPVDVKRNDQISLKEVADFDKILISPGPGIPLEAGITLDLIREYGSSKSILGVCLGHQAIAEAYGGSIINLTTVYHGVTGQMKQVLKGDYLFEGVPLESLMRADITPGWWNQAPCPESWKSWWRMMRATSWPSGIAGMTSGGAVPSRIGPDRIWGQDDIELDQALPRTN